MSCAWRTVQSQLRNSTRRLTTETFQRSQIKCHLCLRNEFKHGQHRNLSQSPTFHNDGQKAPAKTFYELFPETFDKGPPPGAPFSPDLKALRKEFLKLQAKAHPDLVAPEQKRQAEAMSATINEAYKTLQDPLTRARYLLSLRNVDLEDDSMKLDENELLMEVMEAREAIEDVQEEDELVDLKQENQTRIDETVKALEQCFASGDFETAAHHAIRLRYWKNIEESIHGWEQGQGGGLNHH